MKVNARDTHRDLAYIYVGVLISFAFSGIFMNHRDAWDPKQYTYSEEEIRIAVTASEEVNDAFIKAFSDEFKINDVLRRYAAKEDILKISYLNHEVSVDLSTGEGKIEEYRTTPVLGQMAKLHKAESGWWIYYSDAFGIAILTISVTGLFLVRGKNSFRQRGWKLALAGVMFPIIFILFIM